MSEAGADASEEGRPLPATDLPASVLFVCSQNVLRSPMAAELMRRRFGRLVYVESAGVAAGAEVDAFAVAALEELGCDISRHRPKTIDDIVNHTVGKILDRFDIGHNLFERWSGLKQNPAAES